MLIILLFASPQLPNSPAQPSVEKFLINGIINAAVSEVMRYSCFYSFLFPVPCSLFPVPYSLFPIP